MKKKIDKSVISQPIKLHIPLKRIKPAKTKLGRLFQSIRQRMFWVLRYTLVDDAPQKLFWFLLREDASLFPYSVMTCSNLWIASGCSVQVRQLPRLNTNEFGVVYRYLNQEKPEFLIQLRLSLSDTYAVFQYQTVNYSQTQRVAKLLHHIAPGKTGFVQIPTRWKIER